VGGVAASGYGAQRPTYDLDCLVRRKLDNLHRLAAAMRELGARLRVEGLDDDLTTGTGFVIRAAALEDIIASKEWANRPKDRAALPELREIAARQGSHDGRPGPTIHTLVEEAHPSSPGPVAPPGPPRDSAERGPTGPQQWAESATASCRRC
jgi:hypothetical protein